MLFVGSGIGAEAGTCDALLHPLGIRIPVGQISDQGQAVELVAVLLRHTSDAHKAVNEDTIVRVIIGVQEPDDAVRQTRFVLNGDVEVLLQGYLLQRRHIHTGHAGHGEVDGLLISLRGIAAVENEQRLRRSLIKALAACILMTSQEVSASGPNQIGELYHGMSLTARERCVLVSFSEK